MSQRLQGRTAVVTGSSSGNGRGIALALAREGATVVCADMRKSAIDGGYEADIAQDTDDVIRAKGGTARFIETDVTQSAAITNLVDSTVEQFGRLDIFVNNAGLGYIKAFTEETDEEYDLVMDVNAKGTYRCCKAAIRQMLKQEPHNGARGRIVNVASVGGMVGLRQEACYCMSKGAVVLLTKVLAIDYAPELINVNAVCPGVIATSLTRVYLEDPEVNKAIRAITPWPDIGGADDVGDVTAFLVSDDARWATGVIFPIDGGLTAT